VRGRQAHLAQLDAALQGVEASRREEILADVRGHIEEGRTGLDPDDAANVRTLLDRSATPRNRLDRQDRTIMSLLAALVPHPRATRERVPPGALGITSLSQSQIGEVVRDLDAHVEASGPGRWTQARIPSWPPMRWCRGRRSCITRPMPVPGTTIRARSPAKPGGIRRFRYEANGQECPDWFKIPQDLDPASAKWEMFLLGPGATIHA